MSNTFIAGTGSDDLAYVTITVLSAIGTSILFQDVKDNCRGLLFNPMIKFLLLWAFCHNVLKDKQKGFISAVFLLVVYSILLTMSEKFPEAVAGEDRPAVQ